MNLFSIFRPGAKKMSKREQRESLSNILAEMEAVNGPVTNEEIAAELARWPKK